MAVYRLFGHGTDGHGDRIKEATVKVYLAGTTTAITCYTTYAATVAATSTALETSTTGQWECFVKDSDYVSGTLFKSVVSKTGYDTDTQDYLHYF